MRPCRILIVENNEDLAQSLMQLLALEPDLEFVGWTGSALEAVPRACELRADVMLLDLSLPDGSGFEVLARAAQQAPQLRAIFFTGHAGPELAEKAAAHGAAGCVAKGADFDVLAGAIRNAFSGGGFQYYR